MRKTCLGLILISILVGQQAKTQAFFRTEYLGSSAFRDEENQKTGGKGSAMVYQGGFNIPFAVKMNENDRPTGWGIAMGGSYTNLDNKKLSEHIRLKEILNLQLALSHIRPLNNKLSLLASIGVGLYMDTPSLSHASFDNVLASGGAIIIWHLRKNLDLGGGLALNTTFGYPMVFPAFYINWYIDGKYKVNLSMVNAVELSAGMDINKYAALNLVVEMNGSLALMKVDEKKKMFTHQYITAGLQPEIKLLKSLSIPITIGITADRTAYYEDRSLKAFFKGMKREYDPHFSPSFYCSAGIRYGF